MKSELSDIKTDVYHAQESIPLCPDSLLLLLGSCRTSFSRKSGRPVILCIGTDRLIGDSLGPITGSFLLRYGCPCPVYGTLMQPVHALNLDVQSSIIRKHHPNSPVLAIDASLGSRRHQGYITIGNGAIRPGAGAGKTLPEVGDIFITGIVNVSGSFEQLLLQTTRLATIFHMAESISQGILLACRELEAAGTSELLL